MNLSLIRLGALLACAGAIVGCVKARPVVVDRKTQLENQVLGTFHRLREDLVLASSVRGADPRPELSPLQREAIEAMMTREFYRDDIDELKQEQVVGEANTGLLTVIQQPSEPATAQRVEDLVKRENEAREIIMRRVIQLDRSLGERDMPEVRRTFYRLNLQTARPGERVQREDGRWEVIPEQDEDER
jgi:uncharacterized protein YdbL (DUF1318 family)